MCENRCENVCEQTCEKKEIIYRLSKRKNKNKYDKSDIKFHKKVSLGYKKISNDKKRFILIDGMKNKKDIHKKILKYIIS